MARSRYKIFDDHDPYFLTGSTFDRIPLFAKPDLVQIILDFLSAFSYISPDRITIERHILLTSSEITPAGCNATERTAVQK